MFSIFTPFKQFVERETRYVLFFLACCFFFSNVQSQTAPLFTSDEVMEIILKGDLRTAFKDRGDDPDYHPATIEYTAENNTIQIPLKIKTRGHFRKISGNCKYPPILLNFAKSSTPENCVFRGQDKMKLVTPCRGEQYVIHEYLTYRLYNLITPKSFKARLVKVTYQDTVKNKSSDPYYGILLEEEDQMAKRNGCTPIEKIGLRPSATQKEDFLKMAVFEYMIGNTDWSIQYMQNIKLMIADSASLPFAVPYDFDHAGIVQAPYAKPAAELLLSSTQHRRYRGYCIPDMDEFAEVFKLFNDLKEDIYALYEDNPLLHKNYRKSTINFLDEFYETINDPKRAQKAFTYPCDKSGTSNVVIKGLKEH